MIIPDHNRLGGLPHTEGLSDADGSFRIAAPSGLDPETWNSFIGITTAIIGNLLISVALNTQRYAHLRLDKEHRERRRKAQASRGANGRQAENGVHKTTGFGREGSLSRRHADTDDLRRQATDDSRDSARETDPLLPRSEQTNGQHELDDLPKKDQGDAGIAQKSYLKSSLWWVGLVLMIVGEAGNFLAYGFAPASIVSPLGVVALISNCIIAPCILGEKFRKRDFLGVIIAIGGAVTVVVSAKQSNPKLGPKEIWKLINTWEFGTYLGLTVAAIIALAVASDKYGDRSIFIDLGLVALFGGYTALSTKGVASMLSYTLFSALTFPVTYLLAAVLIFTAIMQIRYLNRALQRFDSTQVIPTQFVLFTLSVILGSAILYRDFERTDAENSGEFVGGCALTFAGVWLITSGRRSASEDDDDDESFEYDEDAEADPETMSLIDEVPEPMNEADATDSSVHRSSGPTSAPITARTPSTSMQSKPTISPHSPRFSTFETPVGTPTTPGSATDNLMPESATLTENPWLRSQISLARRGEGPSPLAHPKAPFQKPPMLASYSEPNLPMGSQKSVDLSKIPQTPPVMPSAAAHSHGGNTASPAAAAHSHAATPMTPRTNPSHPFRSSLTELVPGPLLTPLSSSLSGVVADSLRKGVDIGSIKRRRSIARARLPDSPIAPRARGASEADLEAAAATIATMTREGEEVDNPPPGVDRSGEESTPFKSGKKGGVLDKAIGKIFGGKGKKKDAGSGDAESGPSSK